MRIALGVEYNGAAYAGWQRQQGVLTVQEVLEAALSKVANQRVAVQCSGRTDAGVHALQQVVHFDTSAVRSERSWVLGANVNLPHDVAVLWALPVDEAFHARFSALGRRYLYVISTRWVRPALAHRRVSWQRHPLDVGAMREASVCLLGRQDFTSFRAVACQAHSPVRELRRLEISERPGQVLIEVEADGFLHHMVRNFAGSLMAVGKGEHEPGWIAEVLAARDRRVAAATAPPDGLYFLTALYASSWSIPEPLDLPLA